MAADFKILTYAICGVFFLCICESA